ncbi:DUF3168 domain-containing protein, partial [Vibrio parahaemolyticus]|uniref:tail completion protein gp17 n=1 Tax=Vibrio parahaemolyticus TaxID=670 RepID=UPI0013773310
LGPNAERFYPFHDAPETPDTPYALWQMIGGAPENYVNQRPDIDGFSVQIDVYADTVADAMNVAEKLRDAIEPHAYVVAWRGTVREPGTRLYRYSFDVDWLVS